MATIREIIEKRYNELLEKCRRENTIIYGGRTVEDILNDTMLTCIRHFEEQEISEEEGFAFMEKTFLTEVKMKLLKRGREKDKMLVFIPDYPSNL